MSQSELAQPTLCSAERGERSELQRSSAHSYHTEVLRPLSFDHGRRLLSAPFPHGMLGRVLRGRALLAVQSYEAAH